MKKNILLTALICLLSLTLFASAAPAETLSRYSAVYIDSFDTVISLIAFAPSQEAFNAQSTLVHDAFLYMHKLFDCYNSYEDEGITSIYTVNERAAQAPVAVDPIMYGMLKFAKTHYTLCHGQTNVAMGSLLSIWHRYREEGMDDPEHARLPELDELVAASEHVSIDNLILDDAQMTVSFADPEMKLDVGAIAKGYATEIVAKMLESSDMPSFILSAGGNVRIGLPPEDGRKAWGVGIQDPDGAILGNSSIVETLYLADMSVVTSGDYQRFYVVDGETYHHLIDPDTLFPERYYRSVSIITKDSGYADMLSTAAFLMPYEESRAFVESLEDVEAIWLFADGTETMTEGAKRWAKSQGATNPYPN